MSVVTAPNFFKVCIAPKNLKSIQSVELSNEKPKSDFFKIELRAF